MPQNIAKASRVAQNRQTPLLDAIWDTLKPFPGRGRAALRLAVACTFVVIVAETFRMPDQDLLPFFVLFITKEEKVTTAVTVLLVLFAITISITAAILLYKCTGNRAEFRIPGIALEIFIGMYLFRVLALGPVGWILGFICAASQSLVYLFPMISNKPSLFVADAFSNPRHAQFAIKVTLAGMIGYLFYTASDYYGIHTVFYTPLIIALSSSGATVHKGFLRIVGCVIGGILGLICIIWVLPRFESLGTFLFIIFCVHGLAGWIAIGSEGDCAFAPLGRSRRWFSGIER